MPSPFPHQQLAGQDLFSSLASWVVKGKGKAVDGIGLLFFSLATKPSLLLFVMMWPVDRRDGQVGGEVDDGGRDAS